MNTGYDEAGNLGTLACARCGQEWDAKALLTESMTDVEPTEQYKIEPLDELVDTLLGSSEVGPRRSGRVYSWSTSPTPVTDAFTYWWSADHEGDRDQDDAAKEFVQIVYFAAVQAGKGCAECGFRP